MAVHSPIRLVFCITELDPGGAERALTQLVLHLDRNQWEPHVICLGPPGHFAEVLTAAQVPVIGIGAGPDVDGQILVLYDILDIAPGKRTRFSRNYMEGSHSIHHAIGRYAEEVRGRVFPTAEYAFT